MGNAKKDCPSEAHITCPKCEKKGRSRVIKAHMKKDHGSVFQYHCTLISADGIGCTWSCGEKIGCFNTHQQNTHGVDFSDRANHAFAMRDTTPEGAQGHTAVCKAGSAAQAKLVMQAVRVRHKLMKGEGAFEEVNIETVAKVEIGGRMYMPGGTREIVKRHDGRYVCKPAEKLKRKREVKDAVPAKKVKKHTENTHAGSALVAETEDMQSRDGEDIPKVGDKEDIPTVESAEEVTHAAEGAEEVTHTAKSAENPEENIHAGGVTDSRGALEDGDEERELEWNDPDFREVIILLDKPEAQDKSEAQEKSEAQDKSEAQGKSEAQDKSEAQEKSEAQAVEQAQVRKTHELDFLLDKLEEAINLGDDRSGWLMKTVGVKVRDSDGKNIGMKVAAQMLQRMIFAATSKWQYEHALKVKGLWNK